MKIQEVSHPIPGTAPREARRAGVSQGMENLAPAEESVGPAGFRSEIKAATEPIAAAPLLDFPPQGVRNDFSGKYRRAQLAVEGAIYRLKQSQLALQTEGGESEGVTSLPENCNLQQTADEFAMLAHIESVRFRRGG